MPTELEELVEFLHHGNTQIRQIAAENLVGYSLANPQLFTRNSFEPIKDLKLLVRDYAPIARNALTMLINLSGARATASLGGSDGACGGRDGQGTGRKTDQILKLLAGDAAFIEILMLRLTEEWREGAVDEVAMLLANLVKDEQLVKDLVTRERKVPNPVTLKISMQEYGKEAVTREVQASTSKRVLDQLMDLFVRGAEGALEGSLCPGANYDYLAYVFADISRLKEGREYFLTRQEYDGVVPIQKLMVFTDENTKTSVRRKGVASVIKNVCFEIDKHGMLLNKEEEGANLLSYVLLPLMGNEIYDDKESDVMLPDLQLLPPDKQREADKDILGTHLETLLLLTTKKDIREYLRRVGTYPVVRECHLAVEDDEVREICERLVNILMRDEGPDEDEDESQVQEVSKRGEIKVNGTSDGNESSNKTSMEEDNETKMEEIF